MKKKLLVLPCIAAVAIATLSCLCFCSCVTKLPESTANTIELNHKDYEDFIGLVDVIDTSNVDILPLQCGKGNIGFIEDYKVFDDNICILTNGRQELHIFNSVGNCILDFCHIGRAKKEYAEVSDFFIADSRLYILDEMSQKVLIYDDEDNYINTIDVSPLWANKLFVIGGAIYLVNEGSDTSEGKYHLFKINDKGKLIGKYIPFEDSPGLVSNVCYALNNDTAFYIQRNENTMYKITEFCCDPMVSFDFGEYNLPQEYLSYDARQLMTVPNYSKYSIGIDKIYASARYNFVSFQQDSNNYTLIYDRKDSIISHVCRGISFSGKYGVGLTNYSIENNTIYDLYYADELRIMLENKLANPIDSSSNESKTLKELYKSLSDDCNPVIFKFKIIQ